MKKSFLFLVFFLGGCISAPQYATVEKQQDVEKYFAENLNFLPNNYYTKEKIIKTFGKPEVEIKTGKFETLNYIVPDDSGNTLKYAFVLENGTLKKIAYEDFAIGTDFGVIEADFKPWISNECQQVENKACSEDKLLKIYSTETLSQKENKNKIETKIFLKDEFSEKISTEEKLRKIDAFYQVNKQLNKIGIYKSFEQSCSLFSKKAGNLDEIMAVCVEEKELSVYEVFQKETAQNELMKMLK